MREPSERFIERVRRLGQEMKTKSGDGEVIFTNHAIERMYNKRIDVAKVLLVLDNPDRTWSYVNDEGTEYNKSVRAVGKRKVFVTVTYENEYDNELEKSVEKVIVITAAWRARGTKNTNEP